MSALSEAAALPNPLPHERGRLYASRRYVSRGSKLLVQASMQSRKRSMLAIRIFSRVLASGGLSRAELGNLSFSSLRSMVLRLAVKSWLAREAGQRPYTHESFKLPKAPYYGVTDKRSPDAFKGFEPSDLESWLYGLPEKEVGHPGITCLPSQQTYHATPSLASLVIA